MRLATLKDGTRDGRLVVVSKAGDRCAETPAFIPTMQDAMDRWDEVLPEAAAGRDVYPAQYRKICASSKLVLGIDPRADLDLYFSNRTWLTLGCGGCLLTRHVPNLEELFENGRHLAWFAGPEECLERIAFYLPREAERRRIAREGSAYVRSYHTFRHATAELMARVFGEPWD